MVLLAWRDQSSTFLDRMCINQSNTQLKSEGVASIGAFLRMSETMLVLWDVTYVKRLWCLFEVAAFIRSRPDSEKCDLAIVPTHTGPVCLVFNVGVSLVFILCWILLVNGTVSWRRDGKPIASYENRAPLMCFFCSWSTLFLGIQSAIREMPESVVLFRS